MRNNKATNIDEYISTFPAETQRLLQQLRETIRKAAPRAEETISYGMPAFRQHSVLVYFAGYARHIGFYPTGTGIAAFKAELSAFKHSKGAVQFPLDKPLPLALIRKMVQFKAREDEERFRSKKR